MAITDFAKVEHLVKKELTHAQQAAELFRELIDTAKRKPPVGLQTALADSFAIHMRNLIEFLQASRRGDDPRALDFFDNEDSEKAWATAMEDDFQDLRSWREKAHVQLAHITSERVASEETTVTWKPSETIKRIVAALELLQARTKNKSHPFWKMRAPRVSNKLSIESPST